jgi:hypothetical protein
MLQYTAWLTQMAQAYPNLAQLTSIGRTVENRDIWLLKVVYHELLIERFLFHSAHCAQWIAKENRIS